MSNYLQTLIKDSRLHFKTISDDYKASKDKSVFRATGTQIYVGMQGQGKTISAVYHALKLKEFYPDCILVSNLKLSGYIPLSFGSPEELCSVMRHINPKKHYILFQNLNELTLALVGVNNSSKGVIYLIDEIHLYMNALDSKNIPIHVFTEISQQRKQRKCIIGTSQLFLRTAKPLREQCDNIIVCKTKFGLFTTQKAYDGTTIEQDYNGKLSGTLRRTGWFMQTPKLRNSFDTYQKVVSSLDMFENVNKFSLNSNDLKALRGVLKR